MRLHMPVTHCASRLPFLPLCALLLVAAVAAAEWEPIDSAGMRSLRKGNYADALDEVLTDTAFSDTALRWFKLGRAHAGLKNFSKALFYLKRAAQNESLWASFAYEQIGDIEHAQGRHENALQAYRAALESAGPQRYQHYLYGKMYRIVTEYADEIGDVEWLEEIMGPPPVGVEVDLRDMLERFIEEHAWPSLDSLVENLLDTSEYNQTHCDVAGRLIEEPLPDSVLTTKALFRLSKIASLCQSYKASSDWLLEALSRKDFGQAVDEKDYLYHRIRLNYALHNYNKCIRWFKKYEKKYGPTPDLLYIVARSYRAQGKNALATEFYDRHVNEYPNHSRTPDILWYRAWQKEEEGDNASARELYRKIYAGYPRRARADDAFFRCGLSYVKDEKYSSALASFEAFLKKYGDSGMQPSAEYWKAKCLLLLHDMDKARDAFVAISRNNPTDYYAYRAREMLLLMGDSTEQFSIDTVYDEEAAARWLDSTSRPVRESLKPEDSLGLIAGRTLGALGMTEHAEFFLEPLEICYPGNLLLHFKLAGLYKTSGNPTRSFALARRFTWRIPGESRTSVPLALYMLMYPCGFSDIVAPSAERYDVEPELIFAIIRQESIFDPDIVSPAGAVGLMQIMPFTGEEIATAVSDTFAVDSLSNPRINVRYGSYYIRKLLDDFSGNLLLAIAGYNGGPHNVEKWYERNKDEGFDLFVEDIAYTETRGYVKKVLANYWTYKQLAQCNASFVN